MREGERIFGKKKGVSRSEGLREGSWGGCNPRALYSSMTLSIILKEMIMGSVYKIKKCYVHA